MISLTVNGQLQAYPTPLTVQALLEQLTMASKRVAVERNGEIVPRSLHAETELRDGDQLEIVVAVGGG